jgi:hypothetical protein
MRVVPGSGRLLLAGMLATSLAATGCGGASSTSSTQTSATTEASSPASAAATIPTAALAPPQGGLEGFSASGAPRTATSAQRWSEISNEGDEVGAEAARLTRNGFREGVGQHYKAAGGRAALSLALVFDSPEGAAKEVRHYLQVDPRFGLHVESVKVPAIPGAIVVGEGPAGNVLFTTGRCFLLVGDELTPSATPAQVNAVPIAAATATYARVKRLCA